VCYKHQSVNAVTGNNSGFIAIVRRNVTDVTCGRKFMVPSFITGGSK
jgi:hypothetical protein